MERLILHVGAHKTGTTSLQRWLLDNKPRLSEQGINYHLLSKEVRSAIHRRLGERSNLKLNKLARLLKSDLQGNGVWLVSWEGLLGPPFVDGRLYGSAPVAAKILVELRETLCCPIEVVFYVRRQDTFINSTYVQRVKEGKASRFDAYVESIALNSLDWNKPIDALMSRGIPVFVGFHERLCEGDSAFAAPLLDRLEVKNLTVDRLDQLNASYSGRALKMHELINTQCELSPEENRAFRNFLTTRIAGPSPIWNHGKTWPQICKIASRYNESLLSRFSPSESISSYYLYQNHHN